jgi:hypothetical protein
MDLVPSAYAHLFDWEKWTEESRRMAGVWQTAFGKILTAFMSIFILVFSDISPQLFREDSQWRNFEHFLITNLFHSHWFVRFLIAEFWKLLFLNSQENFHTYLFWLIVNMVGKIFFIFFYFFFYQLKSYFVGILITPKVLLPPVTFLRGVRNILEFSLPLVMDTARVKTIWGEGKNFLISFFFYRKIFLRLS